MPSRGNEQFAAQPAGVPRRKDAHEPAGVPQPAGIVERLVRDDLDRKRFLKMAGSAGAASFGAFVLAACGSSKKAASIATC
jgi:hypothetical protein